MGQPVDLEHEIGLPLQQGRKNDIISNHKRFGFPIRFLVSKYDFNSLLCRGSKGFTVGENPLNNMVPDYLSSHFAFRSDR